MIIFSTKKYTYLKQEILNKEPSFEDGVLEEKFFSDNEKYTRIVSKFKNKNVAIIGGTIDDSDLMDIYDLSCALVKLGAKSLNIIIPFFGYSTMERSELEGEIVKAKTRARLLSLIPTAYQGNNIILVDLHKDGISHYFENNVHTINLCTNDLIIEKIKSLNISNYTIGATDEGGAKRIRKIANELNVQPLVVLKRRINNEVFLESSSLVNDSMQHILIVDDMIRSGNTIFQAMNAYSQSNSTIKFTIIATHGIFCDNSFEKLKKDNRVLDIIVSNSHIGSLDKNINFLNISNKIIQTLKELNY